MDEEAGEQMRMDVEPAAQDPKPSSRTSHAAQRPVSGPGTVPADEVRDVPSEPAGTRRPSQVTLPPPPDCGLDLPPEYSDHWCFKVKEIAPLVQLSEKSVRREIWAGRLEVIRLGGSIRISRPSLVAWLKSRERGGDCT